MVEKLTSRQGILLITICRIATILTIMPTIHIEPANQDIWIVILLSSIYTILISLPVIFLSNKFSNLNFIGVMGKIFGKFLGGIIGFIYVLFYIRIGILYTYITTQMIRTSFLPDNKPVITIISLIICSIYISSKGSITIGRYVELFVPVILGSIIIFAILGYNKIDLSILLPIFKDSTFWDINLGAIKLTYLFIDLSVLIMIIPKLENKKDTNKIFISSVFLSVIFILITVILVQTALGIEQAKHSNYPFLSYIRIIRAYSIFERMESIYILIWIIAMMIKISTYIYIANESMKELFKKVSGNKFLYIIGGICILTTWYIADINTKYIELNIVSRIEYIYYFIHKSLIPLIGLFVYFIRRNTLETGERLKG